MTGWLIVNEFLKSDKFNEIHHWILEAAKEFKIDLVLKTNAELLVDLQVNMEKRSRRQVDFVLFWDKDIRLAKHLELLGYPVYNSSHAIANCDDKTMTHLLLTHRGVTMPRTIFAPMTFENIGYTNDTFLQEVCIKLGFPLVLKEAFGSFGQQVYFIRDYEELAEKVRSIGSKPMLFQEFIHTSLGRDIRIQVVDRKVIASMYRSSDSGDFRANITIGGNMKDYCPTKKQCDIAIQCCEILGLDFAGVDILFGEKEEPIVCEVNSNAHFKNIYDCTGVNVAHEILRSIKYKLKYI